MATQSSLDVRLRVLGEFALTSGERGNVLSSLKSRALLTYLACNAGRPQSRDKLIGLLWGDRFEDQARQSLRHALSELRKIVGTDVLQTEQGFVRLDPAFPSDVSLFETQLSTGERDNLRDAVALYRDDLLAGFSLREKPFMVWLATERGRLRDLLLNGLERLIDVTDESLRPADRLELAQRAVSFDPYREQAHREILRALARLGRRNDAIVHYQKLERMLRAELGVEPEPSTHEVFKALCFCTSAPDAVTPQPAEAESNRVVWSKPEEQETPEKRSIAVLPFTNLSGHRKWARLADGISSDIITDLARLNEFTVIARNSSFAYKHKSVDVRQIGKDLGVRYVLEGNLQVSDQEVRVAAELIDAAEGSHVWAARYDRPLGDLFAIQDDITEQVVNTIGGWGGRLARADRDALKRKPPVSLEAYDFCLLGIEQKHRFSRESNANAIGLFSRAVELDPGYARAWLALGLAYDVAAANGFTDDAPFAEQRCRECVEKALALDPSDPKARIVMADLRAHSGDLAAAMEEYRQALASSIGDADTLALAAGSLALVIGDPDYGAELARRAIRLNPSTPSWYFSMLARTEYVRAAYKESITALQHAPPQLPATLLFLAMAHAQMDEIKQARKIAKRLSAEFPGFSVEGFIRGYPVFNPVALSAIREGSTKAGLLP
jgi:TolB-like protein/Tfp pilus assembly protein PilF